MHTNVLSLSLLGLAAQALLAAATPHRLLHALHAPVHNQRLGARHALLHGAPRRQPLVARDAPAPSAATQPLSSELQTFTAWTDQFFASPNATNSADAVAQVKAEVATHATAVTTFLSGASGSLDAGSLAQLQAELTVFQGWADAWCANAPAMSPTDAIGQLKGEIAGYEGWLKAWLSNVGGGAPAPVATPAPVISQVSSSAVQVAVTPAPAPANNPLGATEPAKGPAKQPAKQPAPKQADQQSEQQYAAPAPAAAAPQYVPPVQQSSSTSSAIPTPSPQAASSPATGDTPSDGNSSSTGNSPGSYSPGPSSGSTGGGAPSGNGGAPKLAAWWGQTAAAGTEGLDKVCADPAFDVVIISFLTEYFHAGGMPKLDLGPASGQCSSKQTAAGATGLVDGRNLVPSIKACQASGKKVMLSLGGALASGSQHSGTGSPTSVFGSDGQGQEFAQTLWDLFLGGQSPLRPFGDVKLDGIDIDSEAGDTTGYGAFATALRGKFSGDGSKSYFLSAAPQCPMPDQSIPVEALHQCDFVWVQFYNNGACNHGAGATFTDAVQKWSRNLSGSGAKLYVAAIAATNQGSGYIDADALAKEAAEVKGMGLPNFGGYALWDASLAMGAGGMQTKLKAALG